MAPGEAAQMLPGGVSKLHRPCGPGVSSAALGLRLARSQTAELARSGYPVAQDSSGEERGSGQFSTLTKSPLY